MYGLQVFKDAGATVIAERHGVEYLNSEPARLGLQASRQELAPWVDAQTRLVPADRWIEADLDLQIGGTTFRLRRVGPSHTSDDLVVHAPSERVLFAGDLVFRNRVPYVGRADSKQWIAPRSPGPPAAAPAPSSPAPTPPAAPRAPARFRRRWRWSAPPASALTEPSVTREPGCLGTGRLSPVISDPSAWLSPFARP